LRKVLINKQRNKPNVKTTKMTTVRTFWGGCDTSST